MLSWWLVLALVAAAGAVGLYIFFFPFFMRDPERAIPARPGIVSPADGRVLYVKRVKAGEVAMAVKGGQSIPIEEFTKIEVRGPLGEGILVGIYLSFLDVHVNRAPVAGKVTRIHHDQGKILTMLPLLWNRLKGRSRAGANCDYLVSNERNTIAIEGELPAIVVQIAAWSVRRIDCWVKTGQQLARGDRLGMIRWGSQTDVLFPDLPGIEIQVREGDQVYGGTTLLATLPDAAAPARGPAA